MEQEDNKRPHSLKNETDVGDLFWGCMLGRSTQVSKLSFAATGDLTSHVWRLETDKTAKKYKKSTYNAVRLIIKIDSKK